MADLALHGNGVERFGDRLGVADQLNIKLAYHLLGNHAGRDKYADPGLAESLHECAVVKLANNSRLYLLLGQPAQQAAAKHGFGSWNQKWRALQAVREVFGIVFGKCRSGKKADTAFAQFLAKTFDIEVRRHGAVGNHQIQSLNRQVCQ